MASFFEKFQDKSKDKSNTLTIAPDEQSRMENYINTLGKVEEAIGKISASMSALNSNGNFDQVGSGIQNLNTAIDGLKTKAGDLSSFEQGIGNIVNSMQKLSYNANSASVNIIDQQQVQLVKDFVSTMDAAAQTFDKVSSEINVAKRNFADIIEDVNRFGTISFADTFTRNIEQVNSNIKGLQSNISEVVSNCKDLDNSLDIADSATKLQEYVKTIEDANKQIVSLQSQMHDAQLTPDFDPQKISDLSDAIKVQAEVIHNNLAKALDIDDVLKNATNGTGIANLVSSISEQLSGLNDAFSGEMLNNIAKFAEEIKKAQDQVQSGSLVPETDGAGDALNQLIRMSLLLTDAYKNLSKGADDVTHTHQTLAVDFAKMGQNSAVFESINDAIKNISNSLDEGTKHAKELMDSITDPTKLQNSGIGALFNDLKELQKVMSELKASNDQEGLSLIDPEERQRIQKKAYALQARVNRRHKELLNSSDGIENQKSLYSLNEDVNNMNSSMSKHNRIILDNLQGSNRHGEFAQRLEMSNYNATVSKGNFEGLIRKNELNKIEKVDSKMQGIITNNDTSSALYNMVNLAGSEHAGKSYVSTMNIASHKAHDLAHKARDFHDEVNRSDSKYKMSEKHSINNTMNTEGIVKGTEELAKLMALFKQLEGELVKELQNFTKTGQGDKKVIETKARTLGDLQLRIAGQAGEIGKDINIDGMMGRENYKHMGKDGQAFINALKDEIDLIKKATDYYGEFAGKVANSPEMNSQLNKFKRELEEVGDKIDKNTSKTDNWLKSMSSFFDSSMNKLSRVLGVLGMGALAGGIGGVLSQVPEHWNLMRRATAKTELTDFSIGADYDETMTHNRIVTQGNKLHRMSGGMIGVEELNDRYSSMVRTVGGGYGTSPKQGREDLNKINEETFALSKVYNVGEGTMNDSIKTFYKDLGMSASEATYTIHSLAQTAQASNIPVEKYLKMVSDLAQQYKSIGMDGREAMSIMQNMVHQGATAEQAQKFTGQMGNAISKFGENPSEAAFYGMLAGVSDNPFGGIKAARNSVDENFKPVNGYAQNVSKMIDSKLQLYGAIGEGNDELKWYLANDQFKKMGFSGDMASAATNMYMKDPGAGFETWMKDNKDKMGSPEDMIRKSNEKLENAITSAAGKLSEADRTVADLNAGMRELADKIGYVIDNAIKPIHTWINNLISSVSTKLDSFAKNPIWQMITTNVGGLTKAVILGIAALGALKVLSGVYSASSKIIKMAADKTVMAMDRLIVALNRNSGAKATGKDSGNDWSAEGKGPRGSKGKDGWWNKIKSNGKGILKGGVATVALTALANGGDYLQELAEGKQGATGRFLGNTAVDSFWSLGGSVVGGAIGTLAGPGYGTAAGAMIGGYLGETAGQYINKWTADEDGRGINDRMKSYLANIGSGTSEGNPTPLPISEIDNNFDTPMVPYSGTTASGNWSKNTSNWFSMPTAEAAGNPSLRSIKDDTINDQINQQMNDAVASEPKMETGDQELITMVQGLAGGAELTKEEYKALLNPEINAQKHGEVIEKLNSKLAAESHMSRKELADRQAYQWANLSDEEKRHMKEINNAVKDGSKTTEDKLQEVIRAIYDTKGGSGYQSTGMQGVGDKALQGAPAEYKDMIEDISKRTGVPTSVIAGIAQIESSWDANANVNKWQKGDNVAVGLMQLMPETAAGYGVTNLADPYQNMYAGSLHLQSLYKKYGDWKLVSAAYNGGGGVIDEAIKNTGKKDWESVSNYIHTTYPSQSSDSWDVQTREYVSKFEKATGGVPTGAGNTPSSVATNPSNFNMSAEEMSKWVSGDTENVDKRLLQRLAAMAKANNHQINVDDGFRTYEQQKKLWDESDKSGTMVAAPGHSRHEAGMAVDIFNDSWVKSLSNEELAAYGIHKPMDYENWHVEIDETKGRNTEELINERFGGGRPPNTYTGTNTGTSQAEKDLAWFKKGINPDYVKKGGKSAMDNPFVAGSPIYHILNSSYNSGDPNAKTDYVGIMKDMAGAASAVNFGVNNQALAEQYRQTVLKGKPQTTYDKYMQPTLINDVVKEENGAAAKKSNVYDVSIDKISEETVTENEKNKGITATFVVKGNDDKNAMAEIDKWIEMLKQLGVEIKEVRHEVDGMHVSVADAHNNAAQSYKSIYGLNQG